MASQEEEIKLQLFLLWLQVNGVEFRGCNIKYCDSSKGFGLFSTTNVSDGVFLVVPLNLAITPARVLDDPLLGPPCRAMYEEGEVDDRFLMILFLTVERLRGSNSTWKPYLDMIPSSFGNPLWFTDDEFRELKGTNLYQASISQKKSLLAKFEDKVKNLVPRLLILDGQSEREVAFEDFLWASSVFWTRGLNIPLPLTYIFPEGSEIPASDSISNGLNIASMEGETLCIEGLVPGIDFCNHGIKPAATWEVDSTGTTSGVPLSMFLLSVNSEIGKEITISYGNKGNEVHYPAGALQNDPFADSKTQLLQAQKAELRCLLPKSLLDQGFFPCSSSESNIQECDKNKGPNYSWSGQRKTPSYVNQLVFPEDFMTSLRTVAMQENELFNVQSLLEELVGSEGERVPSEAEVRAAVWEACGDSGALQLLADLLNTKLMDLEEGSGTEESDSKLLEKTDEMMRRNRWASIVYRRGQKQLTRLFLREAEHALQLCLMEEEC
uniref:SET domain-containing protein n=1 Tax=Chenopodium quinoa TaxID=63459 RepID=A0A803KZ26_CHEQI